MQCRQRLPYLGQRFLHLAVYKHPNKLRKLKAISNLKFEKCSGRGEAAALYMLCTRSDCKKLYSVFRRKARALLFFSTASAGDDPASFASVFRWCARMKSLAGGQRAHHHLIKTGLEQNTFLGNLLLHMYCSCGAFRDASTLFSRIQQRNEFTWRIMIVALVQQRHFKRALHLFEEMECTGVVPDRLTFISILTACCNGGFSYLDTGKKVHYLIIICQLDLDTVVGNALITMYGKNDSIADARSTFDSMPSHDVVSWNALITMYANEGQSDEALHLFKQMEKDKLMPDNFTFIAILTAFTSPSALSDGIRVHNLILTSKFKSNVALSNALIKMYGRCASLEGAEETFNAMTERNTITWTTMLAVYAEYGDGLQSFQLYEQIQQESVMPNNVTFVTYIDACTKWQALTTGKQIHACICGIHNKSEVVVDTALMNMYGKCGNVDKSEIVVDTALVNMYGKCGNFKMAWEIFDGMPERSVISWGTIIAIYAQHTLTKEALQLLQQMQQEGEVPDRVVFLSILDACANQELLKEGQRMHACMMSRKSHLDVSLNTALLRTYSECSQLKDAEGIFFRMPDRNVLSWNALIAGYLKFEESKLILFCFNRMQQESLLPDEVTFVSVFSACGVEMDLPSGRQMHTLFWRSGFLSDIILWNALISMYGRCGNLDEAQRVFEKTPNPNTVTWNAVTASFAQNGCTKESLHLFRKMEFKGVKTEKSTFAVILSACSHGGLVDEAFQFFDLMIQDHGIKPMVDHYNCMIDLLARAGRLDEAEILLKRMPCKGDFVSLMSLLGACRLQNDIQRGEHIALHACLTDPGNVTPLIVLANIYAAVETFEDSER